MSNPTDTPAGTGKRPPHRGYRSHAWLAVAAVVVTVLAAAVHVGVQSEHGLTEVLYDRVGADRVRRQERRVQAIDLSVLQALDDRTRTEPLSVQWSGAWYIARDGFYDLMVDADDRIVWKVDGHVGHARSVRDTRLPKRTVWLEAGLHTIDVEYEQHGGDYRLDLFWMPTSEAPRALPPGDLLPAMPNYPRFYVALRAVDRGLVLLWIALLGLGFVAGVRWMVGRLASGDGTVWTGRVRLASQVVPILLLVIVASYAAALRLEATTIRYGMVDHPSWLRALQERALRAVPAIRSSDIRWEPWTASPHAGGILSRYTSDPYTYLLYAREMPSFYAAHYREPVFPFATKLYLRWLGNQDIAVSFASFTFSILALLGTYLLGTLAFGSGWVGLGAALALAIERDAISWGIDGWRDEAFTFAVVLSVAAMVVYRRKPSAARGVALGTAAAFAVLTRMFSLTFLAPAFLFLLIWAPGSRRDRLRGMLIAVATMTALVAPYLVNCWRVYGDPLYSLNYQPRAYLTWEGAQPPAASEPPGAFGYIGAKLSGTPFQTLETAASGMTTYPFMNKWGGFDVWLPGLGHWLAGVALIGLVLLTTSANGWLLLVVLAAAQVPFAFTWKVSSDWRYTAFAYPFYLLAASAAVVHLIALLMRPLKLGWPLTPQRRIQFVSLLGVAACISAAVWVIERTLPALAMQEVLSRNDSAIVSADSRGGAFFIQGWSSPFGNGNVTWRVSQGPVQVLSVPLPRQADYQMVLRLDPFPRPIADPAGRPARVRVHLNGSEVANFDLAWNPERVGGYPFVAPASFVTAGDNRIVFMFDGTPPPADGPPSQPGLSEGAAFSLWSLAIRPA